MLRRILFALFLLCTSLSAAWAERRVALVMATEDYKSIRKLDNPVNDARAMETLLESLGFEVWLETDRDLKRMRRALEDFKTDAKGADVALVFYAGHGVALDGVNYLLPTDASAASSADLAQTALPLEEVKEVLDEIAPMAIMLLDACRDDPFAQGSTGDGRGAVPLAGDTPDLKPPTPGLGRIGRADGVLFAFAAAPGETASDGIDGNSPFTSALLRHLGTKGVELKSALTLVQQDVYDRSRGKQLPYIESGLAELVFISGEGDLPERDQLLMAMAGVTPELRQEVEGVAAEHNMPLAPLYAALISADLANQSGEERQRLLQEAAASYAAFQQGLVKFASSDPRVAELRAKAEEQLALGAMEAARALNTEAAAIDAEAGAAMELDMAQTMAKLVERKLSEATSHVLNAQAARTELRYDLAISDLTKAAELYASVEADLPDRQTKFDYNNLLIDLGDMLILAGNTNSALSVYQTRRAFAEVQVSASPSDFAWSRELVWAWNAVGLVLQQQGHLREAEEAYSRAYDTTSAQNVANPSDVDLMRDLGVTLNTLGGARYALRDFSGALLAYQEGLSISQSLLEIDPESVIYNKDVSVSYERIGDALNELGDREAAREAYGYSLDISKKLADRFPDDPEIRRNLSVSYERLGDTMTAEGDMDSALAAFIEAQKIRDDLLAQDPGNTTRKRDAALIYARVGETYLRMGDPGSALMNHEAARSMRAELMALDPSNMVWARDLSISHENIGFIYLSEQDYPGALEAFGACRDIRLAIASVDPGNLPAQRDLAICVYRWAEATGLAGDAAGAISAHLTGLSIRRANAAADPEERIYQLDLVAGLAALGKLHWDLNELDPAMQEYEEVVSILQNLLQRDPSDLAVRHDVMVYSTDLSAILYQRGDYEASAAYAQSALDAANQLLAPAPTDRAYRVGKMLAMYRLGDAKVQMGDTQGALAAYQQMADLNYQLSAEDPTYIPSAMDYALSMIRVGEQKKALEDFEGAKAAFEVAIQMREWLAAQDPSNLNTQRDHAIALQLMGESYYFSNDPASGLPYEQKAVEILRWIQQQAPDDPYNTIDLASGLDRVASYSADPAPALHEALQLLEDLRAAGNLPDGQEDWINGMRNRLNGN